MARRNRAWADSVFNGGVIAAEGTVLTDLLSDAPVVDTLTAVRIIVDLVVAHGSDEAVSANMSAAVSVGIGVCSVEAFAQGIDALLESQFTTEYPPRGWLYVSTTPAWLGVGTAEASRREAVFKADLMAMRKIDKGILFMAVQNNAILNTKLIDLWGRVRVLCLT